MKNVIKLIKSKLTGASASNTFMPVFVGNKKKADLKPIEEMLQTADAAATYQTQAAMAAYLTTANAALTYQDIAGMASYLTTANAALQYSQNIITRTHAQLLAMQVAGTLKPGQKYAISDFFTTYNQPITALVMTAAVAETLILTATSVDTFDVRVQSIEFPNDILEYDITDVLCEDGVTPRVGKITYRKDDNNNVTFYDHRTVLFDRLGVDTLTFGAGCHDNTISRSTVVGFTYNNIVFGAGCYDNIIGCNTITSTFGDNNYYNKVGSECGNIIFTNNNSQNAIKNYCWDITLGGAATTCYDNVFEDDCANITLEAAAYCIFQQLTSNLTSVTQFNRVTTKQGCASFVGVDFTAATLVHTAYPKTIYQDSVLGNRLSYVANDIPIYADVNA